MNQIPEHITTQNPETAILRSPVRDWLVTRGASERVIGGRAYVIRFDSENADQTAMQMAGLCDMSPLAKFGIKGRDAANRLRCANVDVPTQYFAANSLSDGGLVVCLSAEEFFLESGVPHKSLPAVAEKLVPWNGYAYQVDHQEATFLLTGTSACAVLSQTCGVDFQKVLPRQAVFTRVAGVSCCVFPDSIGSTDCYRIWIDPSYAWYLWETLVAICDSLGGGVFGAGCLFPELLA